MVVRVTHCEFCAPKHVLEIKHGESEFVPLMIQITIVTSFVVAALFPLTALQGGESERHSDGTDDWKEREAARIRCMETESRTCGLLQVCAEVHVDTRSVPE